MALSTHVTNRLSNRRLIELTNPDDSSAASVDTTLLGYAADDAEAWLEMLAGVAYDDDDARHVAVAISAVEFLLISWAGPQGEALLRNRPGNETFEELRNRIEEQLRQLGAVTGRDRVKPQTTSNLTPTREANTGDVLPSLGPGALGGINLRAPGGGRKDP